jgi:hypothetical protein
MGYLTFLSNFYREGMGYTRVFILERHWGDGDGSWIWGKGGLASLGGFVG